MALRASELPSIPSYLSRSGRKSSAGGFASRRVNIHWPALSGFTVSASRVLNIGIKVAMKLNGDVFSKITDRVLRTKALVTRASS